MKIYAIKNADELPAVWSRINVQNDKSIHSQHLTQVQSPNGRATEKYLATFSVRARMKTFENAEM